MEPKIILLFVLSAFAIEGKRIVVKKEGIRPPDPPKARATAPDWGTFQQRLDWFNPWNEQTWQMRYLNSSQFYQPGGPIFVYLGGEWTIFQGTLMTGQIYDMAEEHNGYMFYVEHRFYGESFPTEDLSLESLRYLTTDLALEDFAHFIGHQRSLQEFQGSKVVVIGASYSANLATWMRKKYPHLVDIAYASSGPLRAVKDFYEYLEVVSEAFGEVDASCLQDIREGIVQVEELITTEEGVAQLLQDFNYCDNLALNVEPERSDFFGLFTWTFSGIVQYADNTTIPQICEIMNNSGTTGYEKLVGLMNWYYPDDCSGGYEDFIAWYNSSELTSDATRQWFYQTCSEYGYFQTSASELQPFGQNLLIDYYDAWCQDLYGITLPNTLLDVGIDRINLLYGSVEPVITRVITVHGTIDPWHRLGVLEDINEHSPTIVVPGASHCMDLSSANPETDTPQMYEAKERIKSIIRAWLNDEEEVEDPTTTAAPPNEDGGNGGDGSSSIGGSLLIVLLVTSIGYFAGC